MYCKLEFKSDLQVEVYVYVSCYLKFTSMFKSMSKRKSCKSL